MVDATIMAAGVADLADRPVDEPSGGQRQRVWIAMILAQETSYLLLDEPTTLPRPRPAVRAAGAAGPAAHRRPRGGCRAARPQPGCRFAEHLVVMGDGRIVAQGRPADIVDAPLVERVYGLRRLVLPDPVTGTLLVIPSG